MRSEASWRHHQTRQTLLPLSSRPNLACQELAVGGATPHYAYGNETFCWQIAQKPTAGLPMPTLIRLIITLLFLAGLVYAGMFALVAFVEPTPKQVTIRIPQRDLLAGGQAALPGQAPAAEAPVTQ
jgi:hypothetical protein